MTYHGVRTFLRTSSIAPAYNVAAHRKGELPHTTFLLTSDTQTGDNAPIALNILFLQIVEQTTALTNDFQ